MIVNSDPVFPSYASAGCIDCIKALMNREADSRRALRPSALSPQPSALGPQPSALPLPLTLTPALALPLPLTRLLGGDALKQHAFYKDLDWDALAAVEIPAPWQPFGGPESPHPNTMCENRRKLEP